MRYKIRCPFLGEKKA